MPLREGLRVGIVGATGALGGELIEVLEERRFPLAELVPVATEDSLGVEVELRGEAFPVETEPPSLRGLDLLFLCLPSAAALDWLRLALHAEVPCIDLSGAVASQAEVPLVAADLALPPDALRVPVVSVPPGPALAWALVLAPVHAHAGLRRVVATSLESTSGGGRAGLESLRSEVIALFNQREAPEPSVFPCAVAFDCIPQVGAGAGESPTEAERDLGRYLARLLGAQIPLAVTSIRVPTFVGVGASLALETERPLSSAELCDLLAKAPGVELWDADRPGPTTREPTGRDCAIVGRVRRDPTAEHGLLLWLAADPVRLAAANAVRLAEARFDRRPDRVA